MILERSFTVFLIILVGIFFISSINLPINESSGGVGVGFFPIVSSVLLLVLLLYRLMQSFRESAKNDMNENVVKTDQDNIERNNQSEVKNKVKLQLVLLLSLVLCLILTNVIGMLFSIGLFTIFALTFFEKMSLKASIIFTVLFLIIVYLLFEKWFGLIFPKGIWIF